MWDILQLYNKAHIAITETKTYTDLSQKGTMETVKITKKDINNSEVVRPVSEKTITKLKKRLERRTQWTTSRKH